jgi:nicotinamidase-related amidase
MSSRRSGQQTALLVIDAQVGLVERCAPLGDEVVARIARLIESARSAGAHVLYVQHDGDPEGALAVGTRGWQIAPEIVPAEGDAVLRKRASDAFYETRLEEELKTRGVRRLVVAGFRTEYCVDTTCRRATTLGFDVTLASDAHATTDHDTLMAAQIVAHHNTTLDDFGNDRHVVAIQTASEIVF